MVEDVIDRLRCLGYEYRHEDRDAVEYSALMAEEYVLNSCNLSVIPEGLKTLAVDFACGEFLKAMRDTGMLKGFDINAAVRIVKEGDVSVTYSDGDGGRENFDSLIKYLIKGREGELASYRVLKW